jgi:hypothetical protein
MRSYGPVGWEFVSASNVPRGFFISGHWTAGTLSLREKNFGRETREKDKSRVAV